MPEQLAFDFLDAAFWWQWEGRQMLLEVRNDCRFPRRLRRVVYRLSDVCRAPDLRTARALFGRNYPGAQEILLSCLGPVRKTKHRGRATTEVK